MPLGFTRTERLLLEVTNNYKSDYFHPDLQDQFYVLNK